jgi:hypothetical protein
MTDIVSDGSEIGIDPCSPAHPAVENETDAKTTVVTAPMQ